MKYLYILILIAFCFNELTFAQSDSLKKNSFITKEGAILPEESVPQDVKDDFFKGTYTGKIPKGAKIQYDDLKLPDGTTIRSPGYYWVGQPGKSQQHGGGNGGSAPSGSKGNSQRDEDRKRLTGEKFLALVYEKPVHPAQEALKMGVPRALYANQAQISGLLFGGSPKDSWIKNSSEESIQRYKKQIEFHSQSMKDLQIAQEEYAKNQVLPATQSVSELNKVNLKSLQKKFADTEKNAAIVDSNESEKSSKPAIIIPTNDALYRRILDLKTLKDPDPQVLWKQLEPIVNVKQNRIKNLSPIDRAAIEDIVSTYLDSNGIVNDQVLGEEDGESASYISESIQTPPGDAFGYSIRNRLNKALTQMDQPNRFENALGAMAYYMGADAAYANDAKEVAANLINIGDALLSLTPIGAAVDAAQIISGLATGYDLQGNRMESSDYLLKGIGVVTGAFGGAGIVKIAGTPISKAFLEGAEWVRRSGIGAKVSFLANKSKDAIIQFAETIGIIAIDSQSNRGRLLAAGLRKTRKGYKFNLETREKILNSALRMSSKTSEESTALQCLRKKVDRNQNSAFKGTLLEEAEAQKKLKDVIDNIDTAYPYNKFIEVYNAKGQGVRVKTTIGKEFNTFVEEMIRREKYGK